MKPLILILLCLPALLYAQEFQFRQEFDTIPVEIDGWHPFAPWTGGNGETAPAFCDIDGDGDFDYFQGNVWNRIMYYENIGSNTSPQFKYRTRFYGGIQIDSVYAGRLSPCFVDIDADGDFDLFSSCGHGLVHYWKNVGTAQNAQFTLMTDSLLGNIQFSNPAFLTFCDIDDDNDYDLFIGDNYWGYIHFYRNVGTPQSFNFVLVTDQFQNIDVGQGAKPSFVDIDADGDKDLFIGNFSGKIWYFRNDSSLPNLQFTYITNNYNNIDVGDWAKPAFVDLDGDGDQDMAIGLDVLYPSVPTYGDVAFYQNTGTPQTPAWTLLSNQYLTWDMGGNVGNHGTDIDADGDHDIFVDLQYCSPDYLAFYKNIGTPQLPSFSWITDNYQNIHVNMDASPFFADINGDQKPDLFMGQGIIPNPPYPGLYYYQNVGTPRNAVFNLVTNNLVPWNYETAIRPSLVDIDADGDKDLFLADNGGTYYFFENIGTSTQPSFANPVLHWQGINAPGLPMCFTDIDHDLDYDLFLAGPNYNDLWFYRNDGTPQVPNMHFVTQHFFGMDVELYFPGGMDIVDIDSDGDSDFIFSGQYGGMMFFRNITGDSTAVLQPTKMRPRPSRATLTIGPNPSNPVSLISYSLPSPQEVSLSVYNILGSKVATLVSGKLSAGDHTVSWNATGNASGVYVVRLETPQEEVTQKVVVVK